LPLELLFLVRYAPSRYSPGELTALLQTLSCFRGLGGPPGKMKRKGRGTKRGEGVGRKARGGVEEGKRRGEAGRRGKGRRKRRKGKGRGRRMSAA